MPYTPGIYVNPNAPLSQPGFPTVPGQPTRLPGNWVPVTGTWNPVPSNPHWSPKNPLGR